MIWRVIHKVIQLWPFEWQIRHKQLKYSAALNAVTFTYERLEYFVYFNWFLFRFTKIL